MTVRCLIHFFFTGASLCRCITFSDNLLTRKAGETAPDGHEINIKNTTENGKEKYDYNPTFG